ncbi:hypothetical protein [Streptomyces sp. NPDC006335]
MMADRANGPADASTAAASTTVIDFTVIDSVVLAPLHGQGLPTARLS